MFGVACCCPDSDYLTLQVGAQIRAIAGHGSHDGEGDLSFLIVEAHLMNMFRIAT